MYGINEQLKSLVTFSVKFHPNPAEVVDTPVDTMDSISKNEAKDDEQRNLHKPHDSTALAEKPTPDPNQKDRKSIESPQTKLN